MSTETLVFFLGVIAGIVAASLGVLAVTLAGMPREESDTEVWVEDRVRMSRKGGS